jgi:hypothetical protein
MKFLSFFFGKKQSSKAEESADPVSKSQPNLEEEPWLDDEKKAISWDNVEVPPMPGFEKGAESTGSPSALGTFVDDKGYFTRESPKTPPKPSPANTIEPHASPSVVIAPTGDTVGSTQGTPEGLVAQTSNAVINKYVSSALTEAEKVSQPTIVNPVPLEELLSTAPKIIPDAPPEFLTEVALEISSQAESVLPTQAENIASPPLEDLLEGQPKLIPVPEVPPPEDEAASPEISQPTQVLPVAPKQAEPVPADPIPNGPLRMTREDVIAAYKIFLRRFPESDEVIQSRLNSRVEANLLDFAFVGEFIERADLPVIIFPIAKKLIEASAPAAESTSAPIQTPVTPKINPS